MAADVEPCWWPLRSGCEFTYQCLGRWRYQHRQRHDPALERDEWQQIPSPNPGADQGLSSFLSGVVILTRGTALAVGNGNNCGCGPGTTLIARWNGRAWGQKPAPTVGGGVNLFAVTSLSSSRSWAAGLSGSGDGP